MKAYRLALLTLGMTAFAGAAHAQVIVHGKGDAVLCYEYSAFGNMGTRGAIKTCTAALDQSLSRNDEAATLVNRGILYMRKGDQVSASADYDAAIDLKPDLTEAYVNYGASLIRQRKFDDALEALNMALKDTESSTRAAALYNRAIVFDSKENFGGAYRDLKAALAIRPDWDVALDLISRYEVLPRSTG